MARLSCFLCICAAALAAASPTSAEEAPAESAGEEAPSAEAASTQEAATARARDLFEQGSALVAGSAVSDEDWAAALALFRESYSAYPTPFSLFNAAVCLRMLERFPEALATFDEYFERFGDRLGEPQRQQAQSEVSRITPHVGRIIVVAQHPDSATITLDGDEIAGASEPGLPISLGRHSIEVAAPDHVPARREVNVPAQTTLSVIISLEPVRGGVGTILVEANLADVVVAIDGQPVGTTPLLNQAFVAAAGEHVLSATRAGYEELRQEITLAAGQSQQVELEMEPLAELPDEVAAELFVAADRRRAEVLLDGQLFFGGPLPSGNHALEVRCEGFETDSRVVDLAPGETLSLEIELVPTAVYLERRRSRMRLASYLSGGLGLAVIGTAIGLLVWNLGRADDYSAERQDLIDSRNLPTAEQGRRSLDQRELYDSLHAVENVSWSMVGVGAAAVGAAVVLYVISNRIETAPALAVVPTRRGVAVGFTWAWR